MEYYYYIEPNSTPQKRKDKYIPMSTMMFIVCPKYSIWKILDTITTTEGRVYFDEFLQGEYNEIASAFAHSDIYGKAVIKTKQKYIKKYNATT